jgi:hypothetical protein
MSGLDSSWLGSGFPSQMHTVGTFALDTPLPDCFVLHESIFNPECAGFPSFPVQMP